MPRDRHDRNGVENAVFAVGLLLLVGLVGALVAEAVMRPAGGPALALHTREAAAGLVEVEVQNRGGAVAEAVRVEVCQGDACGEAQIPYVPAGATRRATVGTGGAGPARARVVSFLSP